MSEADSLLSSGPFTDSRNFEETNKAAWDRLYASTDELIWGDRELPFVGESIRFLIERELLPPNPHLLDAAAGEGRNLPALLRTSTNVWACDASPAALSKLESRFGTSVRPCECDLARMPFPSYTFDMILACDIIETLPNPEEVLMEMARTLRPGGILIANVPDFDDGIVDERMEKLPSGEFLYKGDYFFRFQNEAEFTQTLQRCEFRLISCESSTWWEQPHLGYRDEVHRHTSRIVIAAHRLD